MAGRHCDLVVMSTHGLTGIRKLFFGATTERVLRETTVPGPGHAPSRARASVSRRHRDRWCAGCWYPWTSAPSASGRCRSPARLADGDSTSRCCSRTSSSRCASRCSRVAQAPHIDTERRVRAEQTLEALAVDIAGSGQGGSHHGDRRSRGGDRQAGPRARGRADCRRPACLAARRSPHGLGHVSRALPGPTTGPGAAAGRRSGSAGRCPRCRPMSSAGLPSRVRSRSSRPSSRERSDVMISRSETILVANRFQCGVRGGAALRGGARRQAWRFSARYPRRPGPGAGIGVDGSLRLRSRRRCDRGSSPKPSGNSRHWRRPSRDRP